jgi:hypothetical protein
MTTHYDNTHKSLIQEGVLINGKVRKISLSGGFKHKGDENQASIKSSFPKALFIFLTVLAFLLGSTVSPAMAASTATNVAQNTQPSLPLISADAPVQVTGKVYYVDNSCANNGNGLAQTCASAAGVAGAFNSLAAAQSGVQGNQSDNKLLFRAGQTFAGQFTVGAYGTAGHPFTITTYGTGNKPIITGGSRNMLISCSACQYIVVDGFEFTTPSGNTNIYIAAPAKYITIRNSAIHHASSYGVYTWKASYITIDSNDIYWSGSEGINIRMGDTALAIPGVIISNNKIHNNKRYGIMTNGMPGMQGNFSTSKIFGNEIYNNSTGIYLVFSSSWDIYSNNIHHNGKDCQGTNDCPGEDYGFAVQSGSYNEFHDNIVAYSESTGIAIYGEQSSAGNNADGNKIYRNVVHGTLMGARWQRDINWQCWSGNSVGNNNQVFGNIFFGADMNFVIGDSNPAIGGNVAFNNVFYGGNYGVFFEGSSTNAGWTFKNNIFAGNTNQSIYAYQRSGGLTLLNNIYYKSNGGTLVGYGGASYNALNIKNLDPNTRTTNPMFVGTASWSDLRLKAGSPAIGTGLNLGIPYSVGFDSSSTTWPLATANQNDLSAGWEIGPFIYMSLSALETIPPAAIANLAAATGPSAGSVNLAWTAPGDDGMIGTATSYLVRYSTSAISNETTWNAATPVTNGIPTPAAATTAQSMTVTGLTPGNTYYFAVRAQDEVPNLGGLSNSPSAQAKPATPFGLGTYDDADANIAYSGAWTSHSGSGPYLNTLHLTNSPGGSATILFTGTRFRLIYTTFSNRGNLDIFVDNVKITSLNMYNATLSWQKAWTSPTFASGTHTIRLVNVSAYTDIDAISILDATILDVTPPAAIANLAAATGPSAGSVNLAWTAPGDDGTTGTATSYLVRYSTSAISNETTWNAATPVTSGIPTPAAATTAQSMTVTGLTPGNTYYFAVRAQDEVPNLGGLSNSPSAQAKSATTATPVGSGTYDDANANFVYSSAWTAWSGSGPYLNTHHFTNSPGASTTFLFTGTRFNLTYTAYSNRGNLDIFVDDVKITTLNEYSATLIWQNIWTSPTFASGTHTIRLVNVSAYTDIDAITILPDITPVGSGTYDNVDPNIFYSGAWTSYSGSGPYLNTLHFTNSPGASATIIFTGTSFNLIYTAFSNRGNLDIFVDGVKITTLNEYSATLIWQNIWTSPTFASGTHTIRLVNVSAYTDIDAITIVP